MNEIKNYEAGVNAFGNEIIDGFLLAGEDMVEAVREVFPNCMIRYGIYSRLCVSLSIDFMLIGNSDDAINGIGVNDPFLFSALVYPNKDGSMKIEILRNAFDVEPKEKWLAMSIEKAAIRGSNKADLKKLKSFMKSVAPKLKDCLDANVDKRYDKSEHLNKYFNIV